MFNVLIAEDDINTRKLLKTILEDNGYQTFDVSNGEEALEILDRQHIDLLIADIMMPLMDGYTLTQELRDANHHLPVLMLTAKHLPNDKRHGFLAGTDDYMTKPFDEVEMLLRIKALLRRAQIVSAHQMVIGEVTLDYDALTVIRNGVSMVLPPKEFYLLYKLLAYPNKIFTRVQLMDEIWGMETESADNTVNVHINRLRNRFADYMEFEIVTVRGLGYKAVKKV